MWMSWWPVVRWPAWKLLVPPLIEGPQSCSWNRVPTSDTTCAPHRSYGSTPVILPVHLSPGQLFEGERVVTPLEVKRALDNALLDHNVQFLTGTFPAELLVTEDDVPGGLTIVSRSGRQAVRAKVIIDATPDAALTRQSSAKFSAVRSGAQTVPIHRGSEASSRVKRTRSSAGRCPTFSTGRSMRNVRRPESRAWQQIVTPVFEYTLSLQHDSDTFRARSRALNRVRSLVYDPNMVDHSEHLLYLPDNPIIPVVSLDQNSPADRLSDGFRPRGVENLYALSAYAGGWRSPCSFAQIGRRVGVAAGNRATTLPPPKNLRYTTVATAARDLAIAEVAPSFRFRSCPHVELPAHDLPVLGRWDVVVVGGGTAGAPAGIAAGRSGAKTLVVEYLDELGGVGTAGMISNYWYGLQNGFTAEIDEQLGIKNNMVAHEEGRVAPGGVDEE